MVVVYMKIYGDYTVYGQDFQDVQSNAMRRIVFSPDDKHSCVLTEMRDGCICIKNASNIPFEFTFSRNGRMIAVVKYNGTDQHLLVNTNWRINQNTVENKVYKQTFFQIGYKQLFIRICFYSGNPYQPRSIQITTFTLRRKY